MINSYGIVLGLGCLGSKNGNPRTRTLLVLTPCRFRGEKLVFKMRWQAMCSKKTTIEVERYRGSANESVDLTA